MQVKQTLKKRQHSRDRGPINKDVSSMLSNTQSLKSSKPYVHISLFSSIASCVYYDTIAVSHFLIIFSNSFYYWIFSVFFFFSRWSSYLLLFSWPFSLCWWQLIPTAQVQLPDGRPKICRKKMGRGRLSIGQRLFFSYRRQWLQHCNFKYTVSI